MNVRTERPPYAATLVPALTRIQHEFGFLKREALEEFAKDSGLPLNRLQAVASFFPHVRLSPPKKITLRVCRDMACHLAGSAAILRDLGAAADAQLSVEGVSCLGRCDRAPAACVEIRGAEHESYFLGRSAEELKEILDACRNDSPPECDHDADQKYSAGDWVIDPYRGNPPEYLGVQKVIAARNASIASAGRMLAESRKWGTDKIEQFRRGASGQSIPELPVDDAVSDAVLAWQTAADWANDRSLGNWADVLLDEFKAADIRGMGGAGIPAVQKWKDVRDAVRTARARGDDDRAFIVVNGDESEPATFKDRELLLRAPHTIIEGVILAGLITEASQGFIYIRHEYAEQIAACEAEIRRAEALGFCGTNATALGRPFPVSVFVSPGGYICGEQSALIEAMSDRRGDPRNMPPKLETNGLIDLPTLVSNVETFAWAPYILINGGKTYAAHGVNGWQGRRFFSVSGDVKRPGVFEVPMGLTLRELIHGEQYCGGIAGDRPLKAFAPSGPSGGFLPAKLTAARGLPRAHTEKKEWQALAARRGFDPAATELDILDLELELNLFRALSPTQALGAGLVVYAEGRDMAEEAVKSAEFFRNESCGKCVPCRTGSQKFASLGSHLLDGSIPADRWKNELTPLITELGKAIEMASICGLGRSVPMPWRTLITFFPDDIARHLAASAGGSQPKGDMR
jgi:NADH:ubiquinone oxidoreductase subunit F (NADH-binding)/NADH:ubiquinone oxidoreductase subunit E